MASNSRITAIIAGTQSGKTLTGPEWLRREITRRGPGDYLVVSPHFTLLELKALPAFRHLFEDIFQLGKYKASPVRHFAVSSMGTKRLFGEWQGTPTTIYFGYAANPDSLESLTGKGAWLDEPGQKHFRLASWRAILRRMAIHQGRLLLTTTPYDLGWLKTEIYDRRASPGYTVVNFRSDHNPTFPKAEMLRAQADMPDWMFKMFYCGQFERPAGLIYDSFRPEVHKIHRTPLPARFSRYWGLDFGGKNTVCLKYIHDPDENIYTLYETYKPTETRTASEHVAALLEYDRLPDRCWGGAKSEGQWRMEFKSAGLDVLEPVVSDVELGILRVYGAHKHNKLYIFSDQTDYLDEKASYTRETNEIGKVGQEIQNKSEFHCMDAERYVIGSLESKSDANSGVVTAPNPLADLDPIY